MLPAAGARDVALLQDGGLAPPAMPTAPPPPMLLDEVELQRLREGLQAGTAERPSPSQLRLFREATSGRLMWTEQMRALAQTADGGRHLFREAYERGLLADPENLTAADGPWVQALWQPQAAAPAGAASQALQIPVIVTHYSGRSATISIDPQTSTVGAAMQLAAGHFGEASFDPTVNAAFVVGLREGPKVGVRSIVKVTGLIHEEALNGTMGQILQLEGWQCEVVLRGGARRWLHSDNLMPCHSEVVARNRGIKVAPGSLLAEASVGAGSRLLWLQERAATMPHAGSSSNALWRIRSQFASMDMDGDGRISAGEMRNFLWNLNLTDEQFNTVKRRFAPPELRGRDENYITVHDMYFLIATPHLKFPEVPVDALIYEAVLGILGRRTTAHIEKDLSQEDRGIGFSNACWLHCPSYVVSLTLQVTVFACLVVFLIGNLAQDLDLTEDDRSYFGYAALAAYIIYLLHLCCCVRLSTAFYNQTEGLEAVVDLMTRPRYENPHYRWSVTNYHWETRTREERDSEGRTTTKTETVKVETSRYSTSGIIPSTDRTPNFVPQTRAQQTQIDTTLELDTSRSNYEARFHSWCLDHRTDMHQDRSRSESLPSQATSCLAVWLPGSQPCWMNDVCYWLSNIFLLSFFYRWFAQARIGQQHYTYVKMCHDLQY